MSETRRTPHTLKGLGYFCALAAALLFFFGVISPRIVSSSPAMQHSGELQDFYGIRSSLMYYTDLETHQETQDAVRYAMKRSSKIERRHIVP